MPSPRRRRCRSGRRRRLDGKDSTDFLAADGKADTAGRADTLDGNDAADFLSAELVDLLPIAVVNVASNGSLQSSKHRAPVTSTPDSTRLSAGRYLIDLPGAHYHYADDSVACTALSTSARTIGTNSASSDLLVEIFDSGGSNVDERFSCAVYDVS